MEKWQQKLYFHGRLNSQITYIQCTTLHSEFSGAMNIPLQWRHNERNGVSNHQPHDCLLNRLFRHRWKKTSKLRVTGFCVGNSPVTGEFPAQMASNAEKVSIWWRQLELYWQNDLRIKFHMTILCEISSLHYFLCNTILKLTITWNPLYNFTNSLWQRLHMGSRSLSASTYGIRWCYGRYVYM